MASHMGCRGLLLDECDFNLHDATSTDEIVGSIVRHLKEKFEGDFEDTMPTVDIHGIALERFNTSVDLRDYGTRLRWIKPGQGFVETMVKACIEGGLSRSLAETVVQKADFSPLEDDIIRQIHAQLKARNFSEAERLTGLLPNLHETGFPGVRLDFWWEMAEPETLYDFRNANYGPGTRLLVEVGLDRD